MANGYYERGEVYWFRIGGGIGGAMSGHRPGVIVSNNNANARNSAVNVCFTSTKPYNNGQPGHIYTTVTGKDSWIIVEQMASVDKMYIGDLIGRLDASELKELEEALVVALDLGFIDDRKKAEIAAAQAQAEEAKVEAAGRIAEAQEQIAEAKAAEDAYRIEGDMWHRLYDRALDQLVKMKLSSDTQAKMKPVVQAETPELISLPKNNPIVIKADKEPENDGKPVLDDVPQLMDINSCTATALKKVGMSQGLAKNVIKGRPYSKVEDLKAVPGMKTSIYRILSTKVECKDMKPHAKVNINTASAQEIHDVTGLNKTSCYAITGKRKRDGLFKSLEELRDVPRFPTRNPSAYTQYMTLR